MIERRKKTLLLVLPLIILLLGVILTTVLSIQTYRKIAFEHISAFCEIVLDQSPESEQQLLADLKEYHSLSEKELNGNNYLEKYGYRADEFCKGLPVHTFLFPIILFAATVIAVVIGILAFRRQIRKRINELTDYLEQVNIGSGGTLIQAQEDDFSLLQDEMYKTVTSLYQTREAAVTAKKSFAENLANIAHQLKTPITASFLSLQLMKKDTPNEYADQIEKQLERLNRLEESLLMLSKIDAGTLPLKHEKVDLYTVLNLAAENLSDLLQRDGITIDIPDNGCIEFFGDMEWIIRILKFYSNNDFAFKDVHNDEGVYQNGKILVEMVQLFEKYRIVYPSKHQFLGDLFEQLLNKGFKQNEGQFFTPMPIARFIWDSLPVDRMVKSERGTVYPKVIDYACGAGHFLTEAIETINHFVKTDGDNSWARDHIFGIEKDYRLARVAKISLFMNGAGEGNIIFGDGLENVSEKGITNDSFDILVANPPYSVKDFKQHLQLKNNNFSLLDRIGLNGGEIETLFVERIAQLLKMNLMQRKSNY